MENKMYVLFAVGCENCNTPTDFIGAYDNVDYAKELKAKLDKVKAMKGIKQDFFIYRVDKLNVTNGYYLSLSSAAR